MVINHIAAAAVFPGALAMEIESPTSFDKLICTVDGCIKDAEAAHLHESATLLRMAKIDLIARANGISEEELDVFLFALESELRIAEYTTPPELIERRKADELSG